MCSGVRTVYQFVRTLTGKIQEADCLGAAILNPTMHDEQTVNIIQDRFDCVLETREGNSRREFRVRGLDQETSDLTPF
jgi:hypothetical protein